MAKSPYKPLPFWVNPKPEIEVDENGDVIGEKLPSRTLIMDESQCILPLVIDASDPSQLAYMQSQLSLVADKPAPCDSSHFVDAMAVAEMASELSGKSIK